MTYFFQGKGLLKTAWLVNRKNQSAVTDGEDTAVECDTEGNHAGEIEGLPEYRPMLSRPIMSIADVEKIFKSNESEYPPIVQLQEGYHF
jgi:hypothetical protein